MEVAAGTQAEVEAAVAGELLQHVVEHADAGFHVAVAAALEPEGDIDLGFLGPALDRALAHWPSLLAVVPLPSLQAARYRASVRA